MEKRKTRGVDEAEIEARRNQAATYESEQETLKSRLKEKTAQNEAKMALLKARASEVRKIVKLLSPRTGWREFGIADRSVSA